MLCLQGQREEDSRDEFGVWSLGWAQDGQTIIAGTGNESVYVYDANIRRVRPVPCVDSCTLVCQALLGQQGSESEHAIAMQNTSAC